MSRGPCGVGRDGLQADLCAALLPCGLCGFVRPPHAHVFWFSHLHHWHLACLYLCFVLPLLVRTFGNPGKCEASLEVCAQALCRPALVQPLSLVYSFFLLAKVEGVVFLSKKSVWKEVVHEPFLATVAKLLLPFPTLPPDTRTCFSLILGDSYHLMGFVRLALGWLS